MNYSTALETLIDNGYSVGKRVLTTRDGAYVFMDLFIEVSPIVLYDAIQKIRELLPQYDVTSEGTNSGVGRIAIVKN
jgi:hypothetical protein